MQTTITTVDLYDSPDPVNPYDAAGPSPASPGNFLATLKLIDGTIKLDRTWAPYAQATLRVALPSAGVLDQLDPRVSTRRLYLTVVQTGGKDPGTRRFDLQLRSRTVDWVAGTVELTAASDEARMQDALMPYANEYPDLDVRAWIVSWILDNGASPLSWSGTTLPWAPFSGLGGTANASVSSPAGGPAVLQSVPGVSIWDMIAPVVQATGLRLWCDELRRWRLDKTSTVLSSEVDLSLLDDLVSATDTIDRDAGLFADEVVITYSWVDKSGNPHTAYDVGGNVTSAPLGMALQYDTPKPAGGAAARVVSQLKTRGRQLELRARADWAVRPDWVFTAYVSPLLPVPRGLVTAVEFDLLSDQMTLTTRSVVGGAAVSWVQQPKGKSWASIPAGVAWRTYDAGTDLWSSQPAGRTWASIPSGTSWAEYST